MAFRENVQAGQLDIISSDVVETPEKYLSDRSGRREGDIARERGRRGVGRGTEKGREGGSE